MLTHKQLRTQALVDAVVKAEFDKLSDEFSLLDEFLKARTSQGLNLPLFDVPLSRFIMRPSIAVPRPSVSQTASD